MLNSPFSVKASLAAVVKSLTYTIDTNVFEPEINKITSVGRIKPKKIWIVCDGHGKMHVQYLRDPIKTIDKLANLRDKGVITEKEFQRAKTALLDQLSS